MLLEPYEKKHFLLLDGAQDIDIQRNIYEFQEKNSFKPLYWGTQFDNILSVSPCLIEIQKEYHILNWFEQNENIRKLGIYIASDDSFEALFLHLQSLIVAIAHDNEEVIFRFYDPYVLCCCYHAFSLTEIDRLLGPARAWKWRDVEGKKTWLTLQRHSEQVGAVQADTCVTLRSNPFIISDTVLNTYCTARDNIFIEKMHTYFQNNGFRFDASTFTDSARNAIAQGRKYGLTYESSLTLFTMFWMTVSPDFHLVHGIHEIFENDDLHQLEKIELVSDAMQ